MAAHRLHFRLTLAALAAAALAIAAPAHGALTAPVLLAPGPGASVEALPAFGWSPVPGAESYEFQVAADQNFNSPVLGRGEGSFATRNTRATLKKTLPNGRYWWRVRATSKSGAASPWSSPRSLTKAWRAVPNTQTPGAGFPFTFPTAPIALGWSPVPYAASYMFSLASDPALANIVENQGQPVETWATNYTPAFNLLPSGTYYWNVVPVDSEGNKGTASPVSSFSWSWPSTTTPVVTDLVAATEFFDPQFSWGAVPGATKYEVEVNSSSDFAPGSKVCCTQLTVATSLAPTVVFRDNTYYWRVRAVDAAGNAGVWNLGPNFIKTFDKVPPVVAPSIKNLRMRDNLVDPGTDVDPGTAGYQTNVPILKWDTVPGASSYLVEVGQRNGGVCTYGGITSWRVTTSVPSWTPLGTGWNNVQPYPVPGMQVAYDSTALVLNMEYCVRVRANGERDGSFQDVFGDFTTLDNGGGFAFQWTGYPGGGACTPSCNVGYLGAGDYVLPVTGTLTRLTPLFTWRPLSGHQSYYVIVAKDANFSNVVDYAFTQVPAYSPRSLIKATTYSDETTLFYWAILPAVNFNGSVAATDPLAAAASNFQKQSIPPTRISPANGALLSDQPVFRWTQVESARRYRFQVAQEPTFAGPIEDVATAATSYTPVTTYPADTTLYWRVRADDENLIGLNWSAVGTFQRKLPTPTPAADNVPASDFTPVWKWSNVTGASGYTFALDGPSGEHKEWASLRMPNVAFVYLFGPGIWRWRVRAEFPKTAGFVTGPWSGYVPFTRTLSEPSGSATSASGNQVLLSWNWKLGAKDYQVQISQRPDFATTLETVSTDNTSYAPLLSNPFYVMGGSFYWRVAARDKALNTGDWTQAQRINIAQRLRVAVNRPVPRRRWTRVQVTVSNPQGKTVSNARVRVSGVGMRARVGRTNRLGRVSFRLRPRKRGQLLFRASKTGFAPGSLAMRVR